MKFVLLRGFAASCASAGRGSPAASASALERGVTTTMAGFWPGHDLRARYFTLARQSR